MRLLGLLDPGFPRPTPSGADAAGTGHAAISDPTIAGIFLAFLFVPPMFVCFVLGCGHLYDYWQVRGWRHPSQRRKLK